MSDLLENGNNSSENESFSDEEGGDDGETVGLKPKRRGGLRSKVISAFISEETEEALSQVKLLVDKMFQDVAYSKVDVMIGMGLMKKYYSNTPIRTGDTLVDPDMIKECGHWMKFASACFGWKFVYGMLHPNKAKGIAQGVVGGDAVNEKALCKHTGISQPDIVCSNWTSSNFSPGHFIAVDHSRRAVVLAVRGTFHAHDALTDLVAATASFLSGKAHSGCTQAAKRKLTLLGPTLLETYQKNPGYRVVVCGHSLGAAVASLFTLLFHDVYPEVPIHCYAFACPCAMSPDLALDDNTRRLVTTIVVENDIVPRLTFVTLEKLKRVMCALLSQSNTTMQRAFQWASGKSNKGLTAKISELLKVPHAPTVPDASVPSMSELDLLPPGTVYHLYKPDPTPPFLEGDLAKKGYFAELSNPTLFNEIIVADSMFSDHMPNKYEKALSWCARVMEVMKSPTAQTTTTESISVSLSATAIEDGAREQA